MKVGKEWKYLYRAVDTAGGTIEFMLSAKRDVSAAKPPDKGNEVNASSHPLGVSW